MNQQAPHYSIEKLVIERTVEFAMQRPEASPGHLPALLVALHGYGQNCGRFMRVFASLRKKNILIVAPQAPNEFYVKMNPPVVGYTWLTRYERDRSITEFLAYMQRMLEKIQSMHPFDPDRVNFLGFSQGVSMAYRFAIAEVHQTAGVIACGADLPPDVHAKLPTATPFRTFLVHGTEDTVVPLTKAKEAYIQLKKQGLPVEHFFFPGGHEVPVEAVEKIGSWITLQAG